MLDGGEPLGLPAISKKENDMRPSFHSLFAIAGPLLAVATVGAGCGATINTTVAPNANLQQYRTFAFYVPPDKQGQPESVMDQTIRSSLRNDLAAKGMTEAENGSPDFLISYQVKTQQKLEVYSTGYGYWGWPGTSVNQYTQGTLIVDFIDPHAKQVFWRGTASAVVNNPESPNLDKLGKVVGDMVNKYPNVMATSPRQTM
jgi:Domain of unknown function (DUF4136)